MRDVQLHGRRDKVTRPAMSAMVWRVYTSKSAWIGAVDALNGVSRSSGISVAREQPRRMTLLREHASFCDPVARIWVSRY